MGEIDWLELTLNFIAGLGLFLFGMEYMGGGLQKTAGSKMKNLLNILTSNRLLAVLVGAGMTALIQSSSATTVMVVGFVNASLMNLKQAVGVIMGANIGTTITAWIVSLGEWTEFLKPSVLAPIFIGIGVVMIMFTKKNHTKNIGEILFGFGVLFLGLDMMSGAAKPLSKLDEVKDLFIALGGNPILGILTGAVVTAVIQSSSASVGILQALALAGLVPWSSAIYIILGQNIGTCITAVLSSVGAGTNAKRAAMIHFLFNVIGSVIFGIAAIFLFNLALPNLGARFITVTEISIVHTIFNIVNTALLFPFAGVLVFLAEYLIRDKEVPKENVLEYLDERIFETPSLAVESAGKELLRMGKCAKDNVQLAIEALFEKDREKIEEVFANERVINTIQYGMNEYLVKLSTMSLSDDVSHNVTALFQGVSDIERVGDHADNIAELAQNAVEQDALFSDEAKEELKKIATDTLDCFEIALKAYQENNQEMARHAIDLENKIDKLELQMRSKHLRRLVKKTCDPLSGVIFLDMISNLERISDHGANIAKMVLGDTH